MTTGEHNLSILIGSMQPVLCENVFVFCTLPSGKKSPENLRVQARFEEKEGTTFILEEDEAQKIGWDYQFPSRMITLNVHSALDAIGFIAAVATALADHGISVNPVSGFYHDHLFVPKEDANKAVDILSALSKQSVNP